MPKDDIKVVILCGGRGTRAYPYTDYLPKPMLPVNGRPILMHVMRIYASQGFNQFILSLGYRKEVIIDYFDRKALEWTVQLEDTGADTDTGGRIVNCQHLLGDTFMATYSDGLARISLDELLAFHQSHDGLVTVSSVPMVSQYGTIEFDASGRIDAFREKPVLRQFWINAGFFVFDKRVFDHWEGDNLERDVLPSLSRKGLAYAYRAEGTFKSMDTFKDQQDIEVLCADGEF